MFFHTVSGFPTWAGILVGNSVAVLYTVLVSFVHVHQFIVVSDVLRIHRRRDYNTWKGANPIFLQHFLKDTMTFFNIMDPSLISLPSTLPYFQMLYSGVDYFYFQGGIRGVIWADVFQAVVL